MIDSRASLSHPVTLGQNFSWVLAGRVVYVASQWGILVALARFGSPAIVGRYGLALAVTAPIFAFFDANLSTLVATDGQGDYGGQHYWQLRLITTLVALLVAAALSTVYSIELTSIILAVGAAKAMESLSDILFGFMQKVERMPAMGQSLVIRGVLSVVSVAAALRWTGSLLAAVAALIVIRGLILLLFDRPQAQALLASDKAGWHWPALGRLAWLAAPFGLMMVLGSLNTAIPRYFVEAYYGQAALGYFTAIAYLLMAGDTAGLALQQAASPRLARFYAQDRRAFAGLLLKLVGGGMLLGAGGVAVALFFGRSLLTLFYGAQYAAYDHVLVWMMAAGVALYSRRFVNAGLTAMRVIRPQAAVSAVAVIVGLLSAQLLIPAHGPVGAAWVVLISAWLSFLLVMAVTLYQLRQARQR